MHSAWGVDVDAAGDIAVTGWFQDAVNFGGEALWSNGGTDVFIAKISGAGDFVWTRSFGDASYQWASDIAFDPSGNVIAVGTFDGDVDFGGGVVPSLGSDIYVVKLDPQGNHLWSRRIGGYDWESLRSFTVDGMGNVLISGGFSDTMDLDGVPLASGGERDVFITKIDPDGNTLWARQFGSLGPFDDDYGRSIDVDAAGNVIVGGRFETSIDFGQGPIPAAGGRDVFLVKLSPDGDVLWGKGFGGIDDDDLRDLSVDPLGEIALTGSFDGSIDFGGGPLVSAGDSDMFVARLDAAGGHLWSKRLGDADFQVGAAVVRAAAGRIGVAGDLWGSFDPAGRVLTSAGEGDVYVLQLAP